MYLTIYLLLFNPSLDDKRIHTFLMNINSEVKVIARQEIELAYYDNAVSHVSH